MIFSVPRYQRVSAGKRHGRLTKVMAVLVYYNIVLLVVEIKKGQEDQSINRAYKPKEHMVNIWELGAGTSVLNLLNSQKTFAKASMNVVIVVDLSDPDRLWDTLETSIAELRKIFAGV